MKMKYEKPQAETYQVNTDGFMTASSSGDKPIGSFTCSGYKQGQTCGSITWTTTGYSCGNYSNGQCPSVNSPSGSMGDGCNAWKLTCSKF